MLKIISLKNVSHSFSHKRVLESVVFKCTEQEKICIVGENGAGKSTLLKIIAGTITPDAGSIEKTGHVRCYYVPQEFGQADQERSVEEFVRENAGINHLKKVQNFAKTLGIELTPLLATPCRLLSGGQQKILALSTALAVQPDFLLLDEPENHLDIVSRLELIALLQDYRGGVLFISHDRLMIDSLADKVAEVTQGKVHISEGGYEDYIEHRLSRIAGLQRAYDTESKRIKQLSQTIVILRQKALRGKETSAYHRALEELNTLKKAHQDDGRPDDARKKISIRQSGEGFHTGKLLCRIQGAAFRYEGASKDIFHKTDLEMRTGSHIVLLGRNGSGKSTFLKCLVGKLPLTEGGITWAPKLRVAYFDQHAEFDGKETPVTVVMNELSCLDEEARAALGVMKFDLDTMEARIEDLSGGQRMRLRFALAFGAKPDFLLLDEPTNHLDEVTWEILLEACNASKSTILLVSHDHEFVESLKVKTFWVLQKGQIQERSKELAELIEELRA